MATEASSSSCSPGVLESSASGTRSCLPSSGVSLVSEKVRKLRHFSDASICRAAPIWRVLAQRGAVLKNSDGAADTYDMSSPVEVIDAFISHNWSTPRHAKMRVLALVFNTVPSMVIVTIYVALMLALGWTRILPTFRIRTVDDIVLPFGGYCTIAGSPLFLALLIFLPDVMPPIRSRWMNPSVFLDKCCIHQTDPVRKAAGIRGLTAFLANSERLVVVYADTYMGKLWTVYEMATFLAMKRGKGITIVPVFVPTVVFVGVLLFWLIDLAYIITRYQPIQDVLASAGVSQVVEAIPFVGALPFVMTHTWQLRTWHRKLRGLQQQLDDFRVQDVHCFVEADRAFVQENIANFMRSSGFARRRAQDDEAIAAFEDMARKEVKRCLLQATGRHGLRYEHVVLMLLSRPLFALDYMTMGVLGGLPASYIIADATTQLCILLAVFPSSFLLLSAFGRVCPGCQRWVIHALLVALATVLAVVYAWGAVLFLDTVGAGIRTGTYSLIHLFILAALLSLPAAVGFRPSRPSWCGRGCTSWRSARDAEAQAQSNGDDED